MGRRLSLLNTAALAVLLTPAKVAAEVAAESMRGLSSVMRGGYIADDHSGVRPVHPGHRTVAQDKRDARKRRNRLRARGQFRQAVR